MVTGAGAPPGVSVPDTVNRLEGSVGVVQASASATAVVPRRGCHRAAVVRPGMPPSPWAQGRMPRASSDVVGAGVVVEQPSTLRHGVTGGAPPPRPGSPVRARALGDATAPGRGAFGTGGAAHP